MCRPGLGKQWPAVESSSTIQEILIVKKKKIIKKLNAERANKKTTATECIPPQGAVWEV